jgi:hypothetical protein
MTNHRCKNCGKELVCDIPFMETLSDGRKINGLRSNPHGCPEGFDHYQIPASELGYSNDDIKAIFKNATQESGE